MRFLFFCALACFLWGCQHANHRSEYSLRLHWEDTPARPARHAREVELPQSQLIYAIDTQPILWEGHFVNAELIQVEEGLCVLLQCNAAGSRELYRQTASHQGGRLVLMVNDQPLGARLVESPLGDGNLMLFVELPDAEIPTFVADLKHSLKKYSS